jgi:WD40 repeat protein/Flp pilus assembly protein TadD
MLGTPEYMAPEQVEGQAGVASDVWALGVILYEMLTGRRPFESTTPLGTLALVLDEEPVAPARLRSEVPRDVETICLKCLHKDPQRRYGSAAALAEDLRRFGAGEPIAARPVRWPERAAKWARRHPGVAVLAVALVLVTIVGFGLVVWQWQEAVVQKGLAEEKTILAGKEARDAEEARGYEQAERRKAEERLARLYTASGTAFLEKGDELNALPWLVEALRLEGGDAAREEAQRVRLGLILRRSPTLTGAWFHKRAAFLAEPDSLVGVEVPSFAEFTPDGRFLVTAVVGNPPGSPRIYDARTGQLRHSGTFPSGPLRTPGFSRDGQRVVRQQGARGAEETVVWDTTRQEVMATLREVKGETEQAEFSPDGSRVILVCRLTPIVQSEARVWDVATGRPLTPPLRHGPPISPPGVSPPTGSAARIAAVAFSPDGRRIATAGFDRMARVWDAETGKEVGKPREHDGAVDHVAFNPAGRRLASAGLSASSPVPGRSDAARVWDVETGNTVSPALVQPGRILHLAFSPDGRVLATSGQAPPDVRYNVTVGQTQGEGGETRLWDAETGRPLVPPLAHGGAVRQASFSPDGLLLVTACEDRTARVWNVPTRMPFCPPLQHGGGVNHVAFSPDGGLVVTAAADGLVRLWNMGGSEQGVLDLFPDGPPARASFSPDGRRVLLAGGTAAQVRDAVSGKALGPPLGHDHAPLTRAVFSPDGRRVATAGADRAVRLWDADSSKPLAGPLVHRLPVQQVTFSPDGSRLATVSGSGTSRAALWRAFGLDTERYLSSLDGAGADGEAVVWDVVSGKALASELKHGGGVQQASFSPDGRWLLTVALDPQGGGSEARVWDAATGQAVSPPLSPSALGQLPAVPPVALLRGRFLVETAVREGQVCGLVVHAGAGRCEVLAWDPQTGQAVGRVEMSGGVAREASFSRDGRRVLAVVADGPGGVNAGGVYARVWDLATGQATPPLRLEGPVQQAAFSPDGRLVLAAGRAAAKGGEARLWEAESGKQVGPALPLGGPVLHLAFSPDGRRLATACQTRGTESEIRIHDTTSGELLGPPLRHDERIEQVSFSPDGHRLLTATANQARCFDLSPDTRPREELALLGQWLSGHRIDPDAGAVPLEADDLGLVLQQLWSRNSSNLTAPGYRLLAWHRRQADKSYANGQWFGAVKHLDHLLAAGPVDGELYKRRGRAHIEQRESAQAVADCSRAIELGASDWQAWHYRGAGHGQLGHWKEAAADFTRATALNPRFWLSWYGLGHSQSQLGQYDQAVPNYTRATELKIESREDALNVWTERGEANARLGRWKEAAADFEKGIELGIFNSRALFHAAHARLGLGDREGYRRMCALQLEHFEKDTKGGVLNNLAYCCTLAEGAVADSERVVRLAEKVVAIDPKNNDFLNTLGAALYRAGRLDVAAARLQEAIKVHPKDGEPGDWLFLALVRARQGQTDEARRHLDKAIRLFDQSAAGAGEAGGPSWSDRLSFQLLRREAEALVQKGPP